MKKPNKTQYDEDAKDYKMIKFKKSNKPKGTISCIFLLIIIFIIFYGWYCN